MHWQSFYGFQSANLLRQTRPLYQLRHSSAKYCPFSVLALFYVKILTFHCKEKNLIKSKLDFFPVLLSLVLVVFDQLYLLSLALPTLTLSSGMQSINLATSEKFLRSHDSNPGRVGGRQLCYPLCYADPALHQN